MLRLLLTCSRFPVRGDYTKPKPQVQLSLFLQTKITPLPLSAVAWTVQLFPTPTAIIRQPAGGEQVTALVNCSSLPNLKHTVEEKMIKG